MSVNSVVLDGDRCPLSLNSLECTKLRIEGVRIAVQTGLGYPGASKSYQGTGSMVCTNYRMIFVCDPASPLFDSFFVTWNKVEEGGLHRPRWWQLWASATPTYRTIVHPVDDDASLDRSAELIIDFKDPDEATALAECVRESRWTGHLDPENTAEPPPPYPMGPSPPPKYEELFEGRQGGTLEMPADGNDPELNWCEPSPKI